jgi:hypothetical protein
MAAMIPRTTVEAKTIVARAWAMQRATTAKAVRKGGTAAESLET